MSIDHERQHPVRPLLVCGLAPAGFAVVLLIQGAVRPGYNPVSHFGSELSLGPGGWVQTTNFVVTGLLTIAFAVGLRRVLPPGKASTAATALMALSGVCLVVAGLFPTDPLPGYPPASVPGAPTLAGVIHNLNGGLSLFISAATMIVMAWIFARAGRQGWRWYSLVSALVSTVTYVAMIVTFFAAVAAGTLATSPHGLWQRATIVVSFGWISALALRLVRDRALPGCGPVLRPSRPGVKARAGRASKARAVP